MSITTDIVAAARRADPTGRPAATPHPDDVRAALAALGERIAAAAQIHAEAMQDLGAWIQVADEAGVSVSEVARLAGVSRPTIYQHRQ